MIFSGYLQFVTAVAVVVAIYGVFGYFLTLEIKLIPLLVENLEYGKYEKNIFNKLFLNGKIS